MPQIAGFLAKSVPAALQPLVANRINAFAIRSAATKATSSARQAPCAGGELPSGDVVLILNFGPALWVGEHLMATAFHRLTPGSLSPLLDRRD